MRHSTTFASALASVLCVVAAASPAHAAPGDDRWEFAISPYIWLPTVDTELGVEGVPFESDSQTDVADLLNSLDFALMLSAEAHKGRFGVLVDMQSLKLSQEGHLGGPVERETDGELGLFVATLAAEYRVVDEPRFSLDALAGARVLYADVEIDVADGPLGIGFDGGQNETWVDPIVGAKCSYRFTDALALNTYADIGGFGAASDITWQVQATLSYTFNEHFELYAGYRCFADDFERGEFQFDAKLYGPLLGATFRF
jgi:hypothetical protein